MYEVGCSITCKGRVQCLVPHSGHLSIKTCYACDQSPTMKRDQGQSEGPEEICLPLEHQSPSKTSEIMGYFDRVDDRVTVSLHILYSANQETEGSQDRLTV